MGNGVGSHPGNDTSDELGEDEAHEAGDQQSHALSTLQDGARGELVVLHGSRLTVPLPRNCLEIDVVVAL
ncbi:unannotated protein [freshwater metagenome]|uniref:Unannotated protein n=1 Tax=freshwater metagenome TaxID=449393 RepID=A0A6J6X1F6_9ZZZZ